MITNRFPVAIAVCALTAVASAQTRVQILHASDLEGGVNAIGDAPNFAAVVEALEAQAANAALPSILLSAGDNYIPGPFFSAAADVSLRTPLRTVLAQPAAREGEGRVDLAIMNLLRFDASAVGNHEFDAGPAVLREIIGTDIRSNFTEARWLGAQFPYLSSNLDFSGEPALSGLFTPLILQNTAFQGTLADLVAAANAPKIAPATIVTRGGQQFGIVGATTPLLDSITSNGGVLVKNPGAGTNDMTALAAILQPTIDAVRNAGVDKIVLVTHLQQFALEQALAPLLSGVDVIIAGGSDTRLADATDRLRAGDVAQGAYPTLAQNADGEPVLLLSTDGQYSYVGRLVVDFDAQGRVVPGSIVAAESGAYATDDQGVVDLAGSLAAGFAPGSRAAAVKTLTDAVLAIVNARDGNVLGRADVFLEGRRTPVRTEETNLGALTADANLAAARQFDATVLVSHKNGGGIRGQIGSIDGITGELGPNLANPLSGKQAGEISQLDVENSLRFNNGLSLLTLTRAQLKAALEHSVAATGPGATPGQFGQWAGLSFSFDATLPAGARVQYAALTDPSASEPILVQGGVAVGTQPVRIVTLDFLADGGDAYPFLSFVNADPAFASRVNLRTAGLPAGTSTFAVAGSEQDAFAEYLLANFSATPFGREDRAVGADQRVQQIGTRPDLAVTSSANGRKRFLTVSGAEPLSLVVAAFGERAGLTVIDLGSFGLLENGLTSFVVLPAGITNPSGSSTLTLHSSPFFTLDLIAQFWTLAIGDLGQGVLAESTPSVAFTL